MFQKPNSMWKSPFEMNFLEMIEAPTVSPEAGS